nr:DNA-J related domain-containing protein [Alteromonas sp. ASW11-130]
MLETLQHFHGIFKEGVSEYKLIQALQAEPFKLFDERALNNSLALFQTHFVLFNALYQLQQRWRQDETGMLNIHVTNIVLKPYVQNQEGIAKHDSVAAYYLDWNNFSQTSETDVDEMLDSFWQQMAGTHCVDETDISRAKKVLEIPTEKIITKPFLKQRVKRMQHRFHPDKGGDVERSKEIMSAFQLLLKCVNE